MYFPGWKQRFHFFWSSTVYMKYIKISVCVPAEWVMNGRRCYVRATVGSSGQADHRSGQPSVTPTASSWHSTDTVCHWTCPSRSVHMYVCVCVLHHKQSYCSLTSVSLNVCELMTALRLQQSPSSCVCLHFPFHFYSFSLIFPEKSVWSVEMEKYIYDVSLIHSTGNHGRNYIAEISKPSWVYLTWN